MSEYRAGAQLIAPLALAVAALGVLFGYLATTAGFSPLAAMVMSATTFAGSAQFAAVAITGAGGTVAAAVGTAALLNARYLVMGAAVAPVIRGSAWKRLLLAQLIVDETWGVAYVGQGRFSRERLIGSALVLFSAWTVSTAAGALAGNLIGNPTALGLDAAFPALLVVLLWPHLLHGRGLLAAMVGAAIAISLTPLLPAGLPILFAAAASLTGVKQR